MSLQFSSVAQSCPTLCDPMYHSTPGLPVPIFLSFHTVHGVLEARILKWFAIPGFIICLVMRLSRAFFPSTFMTSSVPGSNFVRRDQEQ